MAAASSEDDEWEDIKSRTHQYLETKFNAKVAKAFTECCTQYDDLEEVKNDLEYDDEDSWENSGIVQEIADAATLTDEKQKVLFHRLRVCMGLEEESAESLGISLLDELDFKVKPEDIKKAAQYWATQCPGFSGSNDQTMLKLIAIGMNNDIPLLSLLNDLYQIWRLELAARENKMQVSENEWVNSSKYLSSLKDKTVKQLIIAGLRSYSRRVLPSPILKPHVLVADSLAQYVQIITNMANMVKTMVQSNDKQCLPLQIDLWILSKELQVEKSLGMMPDDSDDDDEEDEDDDSDDMKQNDYILDLGSLDALLKKDNIKYEKDVIQPGNEAHCIRKMRENVNRIVGNQRSIRTVMVLDMKGKENDGKTCDLYSFKAPKPFGDVANDYLYEQMMHHTSGYLVPHPDDEPIDENAKKVDHLKRRPIGGGFTMARREFTVSFHIHSMDNIEMYVWVQGFGVRFLPRHLIEILPAYFKKNDLKENGIDQKYL
eukprot:492230_1